MRENELLHETYLCERNTNPVCAEHDENSNAEELYCYVRHIWDIVLSLFLRPLANESVK